MSQRHYATAVMGLALRRAIACLAGPLVATALLASAPMDTQAQQSGTLCHWHPAQGPWVTATCPMDIFGFARVRVYSPRGSWPPGHIPDPNVDTSYWLFERTNKPGPSLIIHFHRDEHGAAIADLYDDADGDTWVRYIEGLGRLTILEAGGLWTVRVRAPAGWWERDGRINFNLDIEVAGPVIGMLDTPLYLSRLARNGRVNLIAHIRDFNHNGRPDYEWRQAYPPLHEKDGFYHSSVVVNTRDDEPELTGANPFWAILGGVSYELVRPYFESPAPLQMEWDAGLLRAVGEFVASRGRPGNYFVYSIARIQPDQVTPVDFESPFAFYRFGDTDDYPDTLVRVAQAKAGSRWYLPEAGPLPVPMQEIDLSWRHRADARLASRSGFEFGGVGYRWDRPKLDDIAPVWDFKVSLAGRHHITQTVSFPEFTIEMVPFADLPRWVTERTWDFATFVAREGRGYPSSEGLYEWLPLESTHPQGARFLAGLSANSPHDRLSLLPAGFRGEFSFEYGRRPWVYLSPIDGRLHLLGAREGYWNIDGARFLRYRDLDGDGYLDQWTDETYGEPTATLSIQAGQAVLLADDTVALQDVSSVGRYVFRTLVPDSPETWHALRDRLAPFDRLGEAESLLDMLAALPGPRAWLRRATLTGYQLLPGGFAFALTLAPDYEIVQADAPFRGLVGLAPGRYTVRYTTAQGYTIEPLRPPTLVVSSITPLSELAMAQRPLPLVVTVRSEGGERLSALEVALAGALESSTPRRLAAARVTIPADEEVAVPLMWTPPAPGRWQLGVWLDGVPQTGVALDLSIRAAPAADGPGVLLAQGLPLAYMLVLLPVLLGAILTAAVLGLVLARSSEVTLS